MSASCFAPSFYPWQWRVGGEQGVSDEHAALAAWLRMWERRGGWIHAQWALATYQLSIKKIKKKNKQKKECPHHISIGYWRGTEISHWAEPWYLSEEVSQNQPEVKKQAHSAILFSSLMSPFQQMKKPRSRVNDSPKIPQLVYGRAEFGFSSVWEKSHTLLVPTWQMSDFAWLHLWGGCQVLS